VTGLEAAAIAASGFAAGTINTVVGSGTLLTFPVLLGFGYPPVQANVSNTIGLVGGGLTGMHGYRRELAGQERRGLVLGAATVAGAIVGATLLLTLPPGAFKTIVPAFIAIALVLVVAQPWLSKRLETRRAHDVHGHWWTPLAIFVIGLYGGYFGAAQGIILLAVLGLSLTEPLQRVNALKIVLATLANIVGALIFAVAADVAWDVAALLAVGSLAGGVLGARVGRRLPAAVLRALIVAVGIAAIVKLTA